MNPKICLMLKLFLTKLDLIESPSSETLIIKNRILESVDNYRYHLSRSLKLPIENYTSELEEISIQMEKIEVELIGQLLVGIETVSNG